MYIRIWIVYTYPLAGLTLTPGLIPPARVQLTNPALTNSQVRYNLNTGAAFNITCSFIHSSNAFTVSFYKDEVVIRDGDLVNTTLTETALSTTQKIIQLQFLNFQPVHDGVYHCFASASDTNEEESSDLYLYGSGEDYRHVYASLVQQVDTCVCHALQVAEFCMVALVL